MNKPSSSSAVSSSSITNTPERTKRKLVLSKQLSRVGKLILSRSESLDGSWQRAAAAGGEKDHLLEDEEPVSVLDVDSSKRSKSVEDLQQQEEDVKLKIPSSMVKLTEKEKRQLEDVLMRIGLKDCGL